MTAMATGRCILASSTSTSFNSSSIARTSFSIRIRKRVISLPTTSLCFPISAPNLSPPPSLPSLHICASSSPNDTPTTDSSTSEGDLNYILKLFIGSILGSALIKYGSSLLPEITQPNIIQALLMISAPVVVALFLLLKESTKE